MKSSPGPGRFGAVITAMVTPFDDAGELDVDGAVTLARWLAGHGSDGLVVAGTTGEGPVLSDAELGQLWRAVSEAVTVPVIAGTGSNDTRHTVRCTKLAQGAGVDGALVVTPYYSRPSQAGLAAHFRAVAEATTLPVLLYDIPVRAGRKIAHDTMVRLARDVKNIVGVKDAAGDVPGSARVVAEAPAGFELYSGDDALTLPLLAVGAVGAVSVASHWAGEETNDMVAAWFKGDVEGARQTNARLFESYEFESSEDFPNPLPAKAACRVLGLPAGQCRLPLGPAPLELEHSARAVLGNLGRDVSAVAGARAGGSLA
ncbi:MAG TPA: 4-hydroxy-tetrahydrodipicolinate synthase [Acidimicrobiales bacterium]|nr:4-hydroxy-tetrahydrodipicolinate synthase [Acidimicrobiales bacterium]